MGKNPTAGNSQLYRIDAQHTAHPHTASTVGVEYGLGEAVASLCFMVVQLRFALGAA